MAPRRGPPPRGAQDSAAAQVSRGHRHHVPYRNLTLPKPHPRVTAWQRGRAQTECQIARLLCKRQPSAPARRPVPDQRRGWVRPSHAGSLPEGRALGRAREAAQKALPFALKVAKAGVIVVEEYFRRVRGVKPHPMHRAPFPMKPICQGLPQHNAFHCKPTLKQELQTFWLGQSRETSFSAECVDLIIAKTPQVCRGFFSLP